MQIEATIATLAACAAALICVYLVVAGGDE
jgi:hypothetical protein